MAFISRDYPWASVTNAGRLSTAALVTVMIELRGAEAQERHRTKLMRALAISICGRLPPACPRVFEWTGPCC